MEKALELAREAGIDLVEISPKTNPPVAKIISWSKYKYELEKKKKTTKNKSIEQKEIWFKAFIGDGDIQHKLKKVEEFIEKRHPVKMTIRRKGRVNPEVIEGLMRKLIEATAEYADPVSSPKYAGGNYSVVVTKKK